MLFRSPLGDVRFSYTSYRTNDPDMFWNEREESDVTFSIKADVMGASFILEYLNHIDSDPSAYVLRSLATYDQADIVENQANNTTDEAIRQDLEDLAVQLLEQAEKEAAAADKAAKKAARIAALEAKLEAMKNPVGTKARKAATKPSKVKVYKGAAAAELMAA